MATHSRVGSRKSKHHVENLGRRIYFAGYVVINHSLILLLWETIWLNVPARNYEILRNSCKCILFLFSLNACIGAAQWCSRLRRHSWSSGSSGLFCLGRLIDWVIDRLPLCSSAILMDHGCEWSFGGGEGEKDKRCEESRWSRKSCVVFWKEHRVFFALTEFTPEERGLRPVWSAAPEPSTLPDVPNEG